MKRGDNLPCATQRGSSTSPGSAEKPSGRKVATSKGRRDLGRRLLKLDKEDWKP